MQFDPDMLLKNKKKDIYGNEQGATFDVTLILSTIIDIKYIFQKKHCLVSYFYINNFLS